MSVTDLVRELALWAAVVTAWAAANVAWGDLAGDNAVSMVWGAVVGFALGWWSRHRPMWPSKARWESHDTEADA